MVDSVAVLPPGLQITNASGVVQSGAVLKFFDAGTSNTKTVYSDSSLSTSLGVTVTCNSAGRPAASGGSGAEVVIYVGDTAYKLRVETSAGTLLWEYDNIRGAIDTDAIATLVVGSRPTTTKTTNYTVVNGDLGYVILCNCTGGSFTVTLPNASIVGDGWELTVKHVGTANSVTIAGVSAQTIDGSTTRTLLYQYQSITITSDGANYQIIASDSGLSLGKHTIWIPAATMTSRSTNGAAVALTETATNKNMVSTLNFDTATAEYAQFEIAMPKSWDEGTVTFVPIWSHPATTTNFGVVWELQGLARSNDDPIDASFGSSAASTDTGGTTDDIYIGPESNAITIAGSPATDDVVQFQIFRNVSDGGDTMAVDARLHGIKLFINYAAGTDV